MVIIKPERDISGQALLLCVAWADQVVKPLQNITTKQAGVFQCRVEKEDELGPEGSRVGDLGFGVTRSEALRVTKIWITNLTIGDKGGKINK